MKLRIEVDIADAPMNAQAATVAHALIRYGQAVSMLGAVPGFAPLWSPEGAKLLGRAWVEEVQPAEGDA